MTSMATSGVALVLGAGPGLGASLCKLFASKQYKVCVVSSCLASSGRVCGTSDHLVTVRLPRAVAAAPRTSRASPTSPASTSTPLMRLQSQS